MTILGRSEELVSRCIECDLAEPESLASLGGSAPGVVDGILSDIFQTILRLTGQDHFDELCQWMEYKQYYIIDDFYENSYNDLENFDNKGPATEYKWKERTKHLSPIVAQKLKCFIKWMIHEDRPFELHDDFLATLTRDSYLKFRHLGTQSFSSSPSSHHEPSKFKTSFQVNSSTKQHQCPRLP